MLNGLIRSLVLPAGAALMLVAGVPAQAQWHTVSRSRLDSLANPPMAEGREAMAFERTTVTAEPIEEDGGAKSYTFSWRNEGRTPLVITRVRGTCGCAVAAYDREPVAAGAKGTVTVTYHPKGHPGAFRQRIFLYTQLDDTRPTAVLTLAGEVIPSTRPTYAYPHAKGSLLLKHDEVAFAASRRGVESIECLNGGDDTLRISVDTLLLPPCVRAEFVPAVLAPGGVGELTVRFDPSAGRAPRHLPVMLRGLYSLYTDDALGAVIRGMYDYENGDWASRYVIRDLYEDRMTWIAVGDETNVSEYVRCEAVPEEILLQFGGAEEE